MFTLFVDHNVVDPENRALLAVRSSGWLYDRELIGNLRQPTTQPGIAENQRRFALAERTQCILAGITCASRLDVMVFYKVGQELQRFHVPVGAQIELAIACKQTPAVIEH